MTSKTAWASPSSGTMISSPQESQAYAASPCGELRAGLRFFLEGFFFMAAGENNRSKSSPAKLPAVQPAQPSRYALAIPLPPYAYIPGHDLPHPVNDPRGHLYDAQKDSAHEPALSPAVLASLPSEPTARRQTLAATLAADPQWLYALDLFNEGIYWEAHEAWEGFWNALGRSTPEGRFVQGLIHLAAACVKVREGRPAGVSRHTQRARELLGDALAADCGEGNLGVSRESVTAVLAEMEASKPACWHTNSATVVRVLDATLRLAG